jgi:methylenetetrahydrofolate--tRNA-(uracil-5-)-methyltransferase
VNATVVGGGLAGSEAAWALAERGVRVTLHEMRPVVPTPAHRTDRLAELVCSNTFKSVDLTNAHGLLKAELRALGSLLLPCADEARVPGGTALAVDREIFSRTVHERVTSHPNITVVRGEVTELPSPGVVATGPLTSDRLAEAIATRLGTASLAFYDAIAPVVADDSLDHGRLYALSRYGKGGGDDYLNVPLDREGYERFLDALGAADQYQAHDFDQVPYFEGCLPVEEMARRGRETLRFGPMKPVGLPDPRTGREPWAVVQLRREDRAGQMWNLVGFQTRLRIAEQQRVFRMLPGLEEAEFLRYGSIHRNAYLNSPARHRAHGRHQPRSPAVRTSGDRAAADHDARRALPLSARGRSEALPADERKLRSARAAACYRAYPEGSEEGAAGRTGAGGIPRLARGGRVSCRMGRTGGHTDGRTVDRRKLSACPPDRLSAR